MSTKSNFKVTSGLDISTGSLKINGSAGTAGQVLISNGDNNSPTWSAELFDAVYNLTNNSIDLNLGDCFTKTISSPTTFSVTNVKSTGTVNSFILELTNTGSNAVTWWSGIKWASGSAPTLTTNGTDIFGFYSHDGGNTWRASVITKDSR